MKTKGCRGNSPRVVTICKVCGSEIHTTEWAVECGRGQYCCRGCRDIGLSRLLQSRKGQVISLGKKCLSCGKPIVCEVNSIGGRKFCDAECRVRYWKDTLLLSRGCSDVEHE